ncbi:MAG: TIGR00730 family Rossman fold protein [Chloroflexi bacterium]|nr:TIGR00730 family Rossman fold protein [Chloroflexota bacterium]
MKICVYCSSSSVVAEQYKSAARELGKLLGQNKHELIYGAGNIGLMGELASATKAEGGRVVGVIPRRLAEYGLAYALADETIVTETMAERKQEMEARADAFIGLPGGIGTLEEVMQVMTLKQLRYMAKPLVLLNTAGFYDLLLAHLQRLVDESFMNGEFLQLYQVAHDAEEALRMIQEYRASELPLKW